MIDISDFGIIATVFVVFFLIIVEVVAVILVAGYIATCLGLTGVIWWAVAIVLFLVINGIIGLVIR